MKVFLFILFSSLVFAQGKFWDNLYKDRGVSDQATISMSWDSLSVDWHYKFVEAGIKKYFTSKVNVLDVGSGAGHWVRFYGKRGCAITGNDISQVACDSLRVRFLGIEILYGDILTVARNLNYSGRQFDVVNAIGVLHHIVDDNEWRESVRACLLLLRSGGLLFVSSQFVDSTVAKYKKYRSLDKWLCSSIEVVDLIRSNEPKNIRNHDDLLILRRK